MNSRGNALQAPMKLFYLPNEETLGDQFGPRRVFNELLKEGLISDLQIFSFLVESKISGADSKTMDEILRLAKEFQPNIIFWQHPTNFKICPVKLAQLKKTTSNTTLVYHDRTHGGGAQKSYWVYESSRISSRYDNSLWRGKVFLSIQESRGQEYIVRTELF
ncbi:hypothetical protein ACFL0S_13730 [Thermodesulfobacteriota bacterium]